MTNIALEAIASLSGNYSFNYNEGVNVSSGFAGQLLLGGGPFQQVATGSQRAGSRWDAIPIINKNVTNSEEVKD